MASINKLSVRGVRAFSPEDEEQVISFCFPLTIIVGANGCGKTTIIEALKYSVTGCLPPGNKSGQAFVHDPKSTGSSCVKAGIKLRFTNRAGKSMVVVRSMELTQKKTTMSFKALDGILRTTDEDGNRQSLSHKCSELDRQIPQLLGVSKAILEHVVFCHQEDSSWPLMEGAVLKKRFDDIFDSTRYVKALEAIKDTRKRYQNRVKDLKADLGELNGHKHAALGFRQELSKTSEALSDVFDEISEFEAKIKEEKKREAKALKIVEEKAAIEGEVEDQRLAIDRETVRQLEQRKGLKEDLTKKFDKGQLQDMLHSFDQIMEESKRKLERHHRRADEIRKDLAKLQQEKLDITQERGLLMGEKKSHDLDLNTRIHLMEEVANKFGLELTFSQSQETEATFIGTQQTARSNGNDTLVSDRTGGATSTADTSVIHITEEDLQAFNRSVQAKGAELNMQLQERLKQNQKEEDQIQSELSSITAKRMSIENDLIRCQSDRAAAMNDIQKMSRGLTSRIRKSDIDDARGQMEKYSKRRDQVNSDVRLKEIPLSVKEKEAQIQKLKIAIEEDNALIKDLRHCAEEQNSIDILEKQITKDVEDIESMKNADYDLLAKYDVAMPIEDIGNLDASSEAMVAQVEEKLLTSKEEAERCHRQVEIIASRMSKKSALLNHNKTTLMQRKEQYAVLNADGRGVQRIKNILRALRPFEQKTFGTNISVDIDPQELLEHVTKRISEVSTGDEKKEAILWALKRIKKIANKKDSHGNSSRIFCPCCQRDLVTDEDIKGFYQALDELKDAQSELMRGVIQGKTSGGILQNYENWRTGISQSINDWLDFKRIGCEIESIQDTIRIEASELESIKTEHSNATQKNNAIKNTYSELQHLQNVAKQFRNDAIKVADKRHKISQSQNELSMMAPTANGKDLQSIERDLTRKHEEKDSLMNAITSFNKELTDLNALISRVSNQAMKAEQNVRDYEEKYAAEQKAIARKQELNETITKCKTNEGKLQDQIAPIRSKEKAKETEKNRFRSAAKVDEQKMTSNLNDFNHDCDKITIISKKIDEFTSSSTLQRLQALDSEVESLSKSVKENEHELKALEPELESLTAKVNDQDWEKQNVQSNIELLDTMKKLEKLEDEVLLIEMKKSEIKGVEEAEKDYDDSLKKIRSYEHDINRREGSLDTLKVQQRELKRKLQTREYNDIDERHRVKMIENETCVLTVADLDLYSSALDKALLRYHGMKIEEINKIIHELWSITYKGEDITGIRLTSDQEQGSKATRSYNYRVVMTKGTTELDMRGRCSAGQRVLASIVIRLALAETFCLNCGVMALDEPTTNLDYANKRGLAIALAHIISTRAAQENFQLVIITHDEDFVSMMKNELATHTGFPMPERYFHVSREEGSDGVFYSKIHQVDWDEL